MAGPDTDFPLHDRADEGFAELALLRKALHLQGLRVGRGAGVLPHRVEERLLLAPREVADLDGGEHPRDEVGEPDAAPHFSTARAELLREDVPGLPALQLVFTLDTSQIGALSLASHRLEPHGVREGALARKDALTLQVGVDHGDDGLVPRHLPHDARNLREAGERRGDLAIGVVCEYAFTRSGCLRGGNGARHHGFEDAISLPVLASDGAFHVPGEVVAGVVERDEDALHGEAGVYLPPDPRHGLQEAGHAGCRGIFGGTGMRTLSAATSALMRIIPRVGKLSTMT